MTVHHAWAHSLATAAIAGLTFFLGTKLAQRRLYAGTKRNKGAFVLIIDITFTTVSDLTLFLELFKPLALYVAENEPDTLAYEAAIADNNPCRLTIFERYTDKENAFLKVHQESGPFKAFRQAVQERQVGITSKAGQSYIETDIGFM